MVDLVSNDRYAQLLYNTVTRHLLFIAHWELTYRCNLSCRHCYINHNNTQAEFSLAEAKSVLDELAKMNCLFLVLSGGEIFIREDFFEIASYARKKDFVLRLMTNGTLLDKEVCLRIKELSPFSVEMSIYSSEASFHDAVTGVSGSWAKVLKAAELLRGYKIGVVFKFILMKDNLRFFASTRRLVNSLGCDFVFDFGLAPCDDGSFAPLEFRLGKSELKDFFKDNDIPLKSNPELDNIMCRAGLNNILISPSLDIFPCVGLRIKLGNLRHSSLRYIWEKSEGLNFLRNLKRDNFPQCKDCRRLSFCYRCPGLAYTEARDFFAASPFDCMVAEAVEEVVQERQVQEDGTGQKS